MPIRIYALAKELNLDSKVLVDVCNKVGITGKGSALASLSDDEVAKVRDHLSGSRGKRPAVTSTTAVADAADKIPKGFTRDDYIAPTGAGAGKIPVLDVKPTRPLAPKEEEPAEPPPAVEAPEVIEAEIVEAEIVEGPEEEAPATPEEMPPVVAEEIPVEPEETAKAEPEEEEIQEAEEEAEEEKEKDKKVKGPEKAKAAPAIKLAPMPVSAALPKKTKPTEPAPQKPDIRLPPDAIRAGKAGTKPLSEHLRKHEKKRKIAAKKKETPPVSPLEAPPVGDQAAPGRERSRRAARTPAAKGEGPTLGGREHRQLKRKRSSAARRRRGDDDQTTPSRGRTRIRRTGANTAAPRKSNVVVELPCTVRTFSEALGVAAAKVLGKLMELGTVSSIGANLDPDLAELLAAELGVEVEFQREVALEEKLLQGLQEEDTPESLKPRPPVVTFLGHVDHGKTSLLDRIIGIDVVSGEKGGITQHIRAYRVEKEGRAIAFVDTPGHEAFTEMRARGANVTDIAVLVVAADDGIMPQTEEAISHARAAGVPIVVALNKIDLPGIDTARTYAQLAENQIAPTEWGGDTELIKTSAITGEGVDDLLETLLTVAELQEYSANPDRPGIGTCLEAELHEGRGVVAKVLVQRGTLRVGDVIVCGSAFGRVKAMYDTLNPRKRHEEAGPSTPVNITGLNVAPGAGDSFHVLKEIPQARQLADQRMEDARRKELSEVRPHVTLETLFDRLGEDEVQTLNMILRADVRGSIEAIRKELTKLEHPEVQIKILQATVGGITEADVHLADASDAVIIGFNVVPDEGARLLADRRSVQIRRYDIIYQITEDLKAALEGMLKPEQLEKELGRALVQQTFHISRLGTVAGCRVLMGTIERDAHVRVIRESRVIGDYPLHSLRREKDDAREVREGFECGMKLTGFNDLKEGDVLEAYKIEEVARTF